MGAADVVPGVSGGTIAFITGIYDELIHSLKACNFPALKVLIKQGPAAFWKHINGTFLVVLMAGILTSILSLAKLITWAIENYPQLVWSFFFGLILASAWVLAKSLENGLAKNALFLIAGFAFAWVLSSQLPSYVDPSLLFVFIAGSIAICAMVLPGISGSFMLLLMGIYLPVLEAIDARNIPFLLTFVAGCLLGLLSFVHFLSWLLKRYYNQTFAVLIGFLIGSLKLLWPWKEYKTLEIQGQVLEYGTNVSPDVYAGLGQYPALLIPCISLVFLGIMLVLGLYYGSEYLQKQASTTAKS